MFGIKLDIFCYFVSYMVHCTDYRVLSYYDYARCEMVILCCLILLNFLHPRQGRNNIVLYFVWFVHKWIRWRTQYQFIQVSISFLI